MVFIIFIAFFCCWSPYIVVLLYDRTDSLPLPVHLYTSMLAHLHANLNFAIYSLRNQTLRAAHRRLAGRCYRGTTPTNAVVPAVAYGAHYAHTGGGSGGTGDRVSASRALATVGATAPRCDAGAG